jgi:hypothetical protein
MENEDRDEPSLQHKQFIAEINIHFQNIYSLFENGRINNCLSRWGIFFIEEPIQKQAIFCIYCGKFNNVNNLDKLHNRIICNTPFGCMRDRIRRIA